VLRDLLPPVGQEEEEDQEGMGLLCDHMGLLQGMKACSITWLGLVLCVGSEATFTHSGEAVSPTAPSLHVSSGFSDLSASVVPKVLCPSCCRAPPPPPDLSKRFMSSQTD